MQQDVPLSGPLATKMTALSGATLPKFIFTLPMNPLTRPASAAVEDRRYMTSPYNPFMRAANHFSMTKGYYINPEEVLRMLTIEQANRDFEAYIKNNKQLPHADPQMKRLIEIQKSVEKD